MHKREKKHGRWWWTEEKTEKETRGFKANCVCNIYMNRLAQRSTSMWLKVAESYKKTDPSVKCFNKGLKYQHVWLYRSWLTM